jgi:Guanylate-binding protein, C-terminal domain
VYRQDTEKLEAFEDKLRSSLMDEFEKLKRQNAEASARLCKEQIDKLFLLAKEEMAHVRLSQ